jgi:hypothetical protein
VGFRDLLTSSKQSPKGRSLVIISEEEIIEFGEILEREALFDYKDLIVLTIEELKNW